jgi:hypothetical protein
MIQCPQCDVSMRQVTARANPGSLIQLEQCAECGGIWCDKWELFPGRSETASINSDGKEGDALLPEMHGQTGDTQ